jgi:N-methylhydantoinase A
MSRLAVSDQFATEQVNETLRSLDALIEDFSSGLRERGYDDQRTDYFVEGRYAYQVWELEVPVATATFTSEADVHALTREFDAVHERVFAVAEAGQRVEFLTWKARVTSQIPRPGLTDGANGAAQAGSPRNAAERDAYFPGDGWLRTPLYEGAALGPGARVEGPAIIAEPTSTLVVPPGSNAAVTPRGHYLVEVR